MPNVKTVAPVAPLFPELARRFRFIDLFAGIGGIRLGLERAGGECVFTVEFDRFAMQTYSANYAEVGPDGERVDMAPVDIYAVDPTTHPQYDVLAAGFPCQPFSIAGVSKNLSLGREHGFDHAKSGNLFFEIVRLIDEAPAPPPVLFLENVKHLRRHDHGRTFAVIVATLEDRGYNVASQIIDAKPWVPQHRERTFIVGFHRDRYGDQAFEFPPNSARPVRPWPTLRKVLQPPAEVDPKYTLTDHLWEYLFEYAARHRAAGNGFGYGLVGPSDVARTLSARYYKDGSEVLYSRHPHRVVKRLANEQLVRVPGQNPRRLTPRECARLMGYPDSFLIPVSDTQAYRQFGNSVVVPVIEFLGRAIADQAFPLPPQKCLVDGMELRLRGKVDGQADGSGQLAGADCGPGLGVVRQATLGE